MSFQKEDLYNQVETVLNEVLQFLQNTEDEQINLLPFTNSWTIGQLVEHIIICSQGIPDHTTQHTDRPFNEKQTDLRNIFLNMEQKSQADPRVCPSDPPHHKVDLLDALEVNKNRLLEIISERDLSKLCTDSEMPFLGYLTRYEWLYFIYVHTQRHLNQLHNIRQILQN